MNKRLIFIMVVSLVITVSVIAGFIVLLVFGKKRVTLSTVPINAHYKIGSTEGETPTSLNLKPGNYQIELTAENYETIKTSFSVRPLGKTPSLSYALNFIYPTPPKSATENNFGGKPDPNLQKKSQAVQEKYASFYSKLPVKEVNFYISLPTWDDKFFIYVPKGNPEEGKGAALNWFSNNGVVQPSSLNVIWQYR